MCVTDRSGTPHPGPSPGEEYSEEPDPSEAFAKRVGTPK